MDPRYPQIFDPETMTVTTEKPSNQDADSFRGYHNMAALLPNGAVVVGGGFNQHGDVGCENPDLRVFSPSYLKAGPRPLPAATMLGAEPLRFKVGQKGASIELRLKQDATLCPVKGVAFLAPQALTHSYGESQGMCV